MPPFSPSNCQHPLHKSPLPTTARNNVIASQTCLRRRLSRCIHAPTVAHPRETNSFGAHQRLREKAAKRRFPRGPDRPSKRLLGLFGLQGSRGRRASDERREDARREAESLPLACLPGRFALACDIHRCMIVDALVSFSVILLLLSSRLSPLRPRGTAKVLTPLRAGCGGQTGGLSTGPTRALPLELELALSCLWSARLG